MLCHVGFPCECLPRLQLIAGILSSSTGPSARRVFDYTHCGGLTTADAAHEYDLPLLGDLAGFCGWRVVSVSSPQVSFTAGKPSQRAATIFAGSARQGIDSDEVRSVAGWRCSSCGWRRG